MDQAGIPAAETYPPDKHDQLVRAAGKLWDSTGEQDPRRVLSADDREALDLAVGWYRADRDREMASIDDLGVTARPLPPPDAHAPLSVLNRTGRGLRTMTVCSCGHRPANAPQSGNAMFTAHMAHLRTLGRPPADYSTQVFGEGPWTGWTRHEWHAQYGGRGIDPYTGQEPLSDAHRATELARLEAAFAEAGGRGVDLAERIDALRARQDDNTDRLTRLASSLGVNETGLDDYVHDLASRPASDINNSGLEGQVTYLIRQAGAAEAERMIREAAQQDTGRH